MSVAAYESKFHALSFCASQLLTFEEEKIILFIKGLKIDLPICLDYMNFVGKSFNDVVNYLKKFKCVNLVG